MTEARIPSRKMFVLVGIVAMALTPSLARASKTYPLVLKEELGLDYEPECTICHTTKDGGNKTVTKPFGRALVQLGLVAGSNQSLRNTLALAEGLDSDGDTVSDLDELKAGRDPNIQQPIADGGRLPPPPLQPPILRTGCSVGGWRGNAPSDGVSAALVAIALAARRRARRARR
jgi:hypothetical protein